MKTLIRIGALICALGFPLSAQAQLIAPGHVEGNGTSAPRSPTDTALGAVMDQALSTSATNDVIPYRIGGVWGGLGLLGTAHTWTGQQTFASPISGNLDVIGTITSRRSTATDIGGTLILGHGAYPWQIATNQVTGGDFSIINPSGATVLYIPQTGVNVNVGQGVGLSRLYVFGSQFVASQGPLLILQGGSQTIAQLGADCAILASPCNTDFYIVGPNSSRSANFYQWATVSVNTTLTASPTRYVGGALAIITDTANTFAGGNGITSQVNLTTSGNFPTAITALVNATGTAATAWGIFAECDLHAAVECAAVEATAGNKAGAPNVPPISTVSAPTQPFVTALKATCGGLITPSSAGTNGCSVGLWIHYYNGNGGWPFLYGIYLTEGVASTVGIQVNATATLSPTTSAIFKNSGTGRTLVLQQMDAGSPGSHTMELLNSTGSVTFAIDNNGTLDAPTIQGGNLNALAGLSLINSGFNQSFASGGTLTANRTLTVNLNNTSPTLSVNGNVSFAGAFGFTATLTGTTNVTFPTSGTLATTASSAASIVVGTTTVTSGTTTRVLFDNVGVLGEYAISGTGSVCMTTSCAMSTPTISGGTATGIASFGLNNGGFNLFLAAGGAQTANRTLTFNTSDASATLTTTSSTSVGQGQYLGSAAADSATAGNIGELFSASVPNGSATALVNSTAKTVTSITLSAGDWDVTGEVGVTLAATTTVTEVDCNISSTNNTFDGTIGTYSTVSYPSGTTLGSATFPLLTCPVVRKSLSSSTTIYLIALSSFGTSTNAAFGAIRARRIR